MFDSKKSPYIYSREQMEKELQIDRGNNNNAYTTNNVHIIKEFYNNSTILITGGTGFLGKVLIEKILRSCEQVQCVYVLLRPKRGLTSDQRYTELIQNPVIFFFL